MTEVVPLGLGQLLLATSLLLVNGVISLSLGLRLEWPLFRSAGRMIVQLLLIGWVLERVLRLTNPLWLVLVTAVMILAAGQAVLERTTWRFPGLYLGSYLAILGPSLLITQITVADIVSIHPWYSAQYWIPFLGMILGNALTGAALVLNQLLASLAAGRHQIETLLAHGATRWEASQSVFRGAVQTALTPTLNSMAVMGLVSLPGMMTGQILAGSAPTLAVRYQLVIMLSISAATALTVLVLAGWVVQRLFDPEHRLRLDKLQATEVH